MTKIIFTDETIRVKKVTVGTPIKRVTSGSFTIFALTGVDAATPSHGDLLVYDSDAGVYVTSQLSVAGNLTKDFDNLSDVLEISTNLDAIGEHLIPAGDITYDLGSTDNRWRDLYLSGQTITLGRITLQESGGEFVVKDSGGNTILVNPKLSTNNPNILTYDSGNGTFTFNDSDIARTDVAETFHSHLTVSGDLTTIGSQIVQQNLSVLGNATVTGYLNVSDSATISSNLNVGGTLTVNGDLLVSGTTTTINTETIQLADNTIVLNSNATGAPIENAGIEVERGDSANKLLVWDENTDRWTVNGETFHAGTLDGDLLVATDANIDSASITTLKGGTVSATTLTFDTLTNTTSDITEGANLYYTRGRFDSALGDATSIGTIRGYFTANKGLVVTDGEFNLDSANVRNIFSATGDLTYDANTGQFSIDVEQVYSKENFDSDLGAAIAGGTGITYDSSTDTISITDTGVVAGTYGSATQIPIFTVNAQGQLDSAGSVAVAGLTSFAFDSATGSISIGTADASTFSTVITLDPFTTSNLVEGSNLYYTKARVDSDFDARLATKSTTDVAEGTNLYYTRGRFDSALGDATSTSTIRALFSAGGDLTYNSGTGEFTFDVEQVYTKTNFDSDLNLALSTSAVTTTQLIEGDNLYYTTARSDSDFDVRLATKSTSDVTEGTNLYYTQTRVDSAFDARLATKSTDNLTEGDNLYYTTSRADSDFDVRLTTKSTTDLVEGINLYYTSTRVDSDFDARLAIKTTSDLTEGSNEYYTVEKVNAAFDTRLATKSTTDLAEGDNLYYTTSRADSDFDVRLATKSTDDLTEGSVNIYYTQQRHDSDFDTRLAIKSTTNLSEGDNLYYTTARADSDAKNAVSAVDAGGDGSFSYNADLGQFTYTGPSATEVRAHFQAGTGVTYDSASGTFSIGQAVAVTSDVQFNDVQIDGNLTVSGTTTTVNTETINLADNIILINSNATGVPSQDGGIEIERGDSDNKTLLWNETTNKWTVGSETFVAATFEGNLTGNVTGTVSSISNHTTTDLAEGDNLYYTTARADSDFDVRLATKSTSDVSEGTNLYYTTARVDSDIDAAFVAKSTDDLSEGSNLYYTTARADSDAKNSVSVTDNGGDGSLSYNPATGIFTYTGPSATEVRAHFVAGGDLAYDSATGVFSFTQRTDQGVRNLFSVSGDLAYDSATGQFSFTERTDQEVKNLFSVSGDLAYDSAAGQFSFTERTDQEVKNLFSVSGDLAYDSAAGQFSFTERTDQEVRNLFSVSGDLSYDSATGQFSIDVEQVYTKANFDSDLNASSTSNLPEGTNLYYTTARADSDAKAALFVVDAGGDGSLTYDSATGVFTYTGPSATEVRAHFSGGTGVDITDGVVSIGQSVGTSDTVTFSTVNVGTVSATNVNSTYVDADSSTITTITTSTANVGNVNATNVSADSATITNLATTQITGSQATFDSASVLNLRSATATLDSATIPNLATSQITGSQATLDSANIGTLLVTGNAKVDGNLTVVGDIGFDDVTADSATFTGTVSIGTKVTSPLANLDSATIGTLKFTTLVNTTSDITEGTNLYYTDGRFDTRLATKSTTDIAEGTNLYYTKVRTDSDIDAAFAAKSTSNLSEGSNLYYTSARADSDAKNAISVTDNGGDGSLTYSAATGVITYTGPSASEVRAHFSNGTGVTITDGSIAIGQSVGTTDDVTFGKVTQDSAVINQQINLTRTTVIPTAAGSLYYDSDPQKGLSFIPTTNEGVQDVTINIGQETLIYVHNLTGAQINNGQAVYISGVAHGAHPQVTLAKADNASTASPIGLATMDIPDGAHGYVTKVGIVRDVNTGGMTAGGTAYLSADSAGQWSTTEVSVDSGYPTHIGTILTVDSSVGTILVNVEKEHFEYLRVQDKIITNDLVAPDIYGSHIHFDGKAPGYYAEGLVYYDSANGALVVKNDEADVTLQVGQEEWIRVYNNSGSTITNGTPVYLSGEVGAIPSIEPADAVNAFGSVGLATHDIENGTTGYVTTRGLVGDINTVGLTVGTKVHLASGGGLTNTAPQFPFYPTDIGICLIEDSAVGCIYVDVIDHTMETIRVTQDARFDANVTIGGNLNVIGVTSEVISQSLTTSANLLQLLDGDTVGTAYQNTGGLDDATFKGKYTGDSDVFYFVRMVSVDSAGVGDVIEWGVSDSDQMLYGAYAGQYGYGKPFDSDGSGKTSWNLKDDGLTAPLREGLSIQFINLSGHDSADVWCAHPTELNLDLGVIGNYNQANEPIKYAGVVRDATDERWKFFDGLPASSVDSSSSRFDINFDSATFADIQFATAYGNLSGNATTATSATQLANPRNFSLTGDITASAVSFNGTGNVSLVTAIAAGSIVNADISATAAITDGKLATISTAGKVQNSATTATAANTASAIVTRDASGNFSAGIITADINRDAHTTVVAGTYGSTTAIPVITIDANGFVDSVGTVGVSGITGVSFDSSNGALTIQTSTGNFIDSINLSPFTTDNLAQGSTNKYYDSATTTTNARNSISATGDLSYNPATGVIDFSETYSSASELLTAIKTVDGTTSGLDADLLDGQEGTYYRINVYNSSGTLLN